MKLFMHFNLSFPGFRMVLRGREQKAGDAAELLGKNMTR